MCAGTDGGGCQPAGAAAEGQTSPDTAAVVAVHLRAQAPPRGAAPDVLAPVTTVAPAVVRAGMSCVLARLPCNGWLEIANCHAHFADRYCAYSLQIAPVQSSH